MVCGSEVQNEIDALLLNKQILLDERAEIAEVFRLRILAATDKNAVKVARAEAFRVIDEQINPIDIRLKELETLIARDCEPIFSTISLDLSSWDRTKAINVSIKGFVSWCVVRFQFGSVKTILFVNDNAGNELLGIEIFRGQFQVTRPTGSQPKLCLSFDFTKTLSFKDQIPENVNFITLEIRTIPIHGPFISNLKHVLEKFDVHVPIKSEPESIPEPEEPPSEPSEGLTLDQKIGIIVGGIAVAIGIAFGAILAQKPR